MVCQGSPWLNRGPIGLTTGPFDVLWTAAQLESAESAIESETNEKFPPIKEPVTNENLDTKLDHIIDQLKTISLTAVENKGVPIRNENESLNEQTLAKDEATKCLKLARSVWDIERAGFIYDVEKDLLTCIVCDENVSKQDSIAFFFS